MREYEERLVELNEECRKENAKKMECSKTLAEKIAAGDKMDDTLRTLSQHISQLEKIEYPGDNEREMLVRFRSIILNWSRTVPSLFI